MHGQAPVKVPASSTREWEMGWAGRGRCVDAQAQRRLVAKKPKQMGGGTEHIAGMSVWEGGTPKGG